MRFRLEKGLKREKRDKIVDGWNKNRRVIELHRSIVRIVPYITIFL